MGLENEVIDVKSQERCVTLTWLDGSQHEAKLNWLQQMEEGYFLAGLTYTHLSRQSGNECHTEWVLKLDSEVGFMPMFCSLYW